MKSINKKLLTVLISTSVLLTACSDDSTSKSESKNISGNTVESKNNEKDEFIKGLQTMREVDLSTLIKPPKEDGTLQGTNFVNSVNTEYIEFVEKKHDNGAMDTTISSQSNIVRYNQFQPKEKYVIVTNVKENDKQIYDDGTNSYKLPERTGDKTIKYLYKDAGYLKKAVKEKQTGSFNIDDYEFKSEIEKVKSSEDIVKKEITSAIKENSEEIEKYYMLLDNSERDELKTEYKVAVKNPNKYRDLLLSRFSDEIKSKVNMKEITNMQVSTSVNSPELLIEYTYTDDNGKELKGNKNIFIGFLSDVGANNRSDFYYPKNEIEEEIRGNEIFGR